MVARVQHHRALDSWRGLCALLVALFHFPVAGALLESPFIRHSYLFVDFFFVLSGFIIAKTQDQRPDSLGVFLIKRFGRIWPLHAAALLAFVFVAIVQGDLGSDERHSYGAIFTNALMIHAWGIHQDLTWNDPSWSVSVEWFLYLLFGGLTLMPRRQFIYAALVVVGIGALFFFAPSGMGSTFDFGIYRGLAGFFVGALIARAPLRDLGTRGEIATVLGVLVFVAMGQALFIASFVFGAAVWVFAGSRGRITRFLEARPFIWLGERSYTTYILHAMVVAVVWMVGHQMGWSQSAGKFLVPMGDLLAVPYLAVIAAVAWMAYPLEDVARKWFRRSADALAQHRSAA